MPFYVITRPISISESKIFSVAKTMIGLMVIILIVYIWPIIIPVGNRYQYDEAVYAYLQIKANLPYLNWTIVGPEEELQLALTYGQHKELWEFVQSISTPDHAKLKIDTDYIFIFTEKIPLGSKQNITEADAQKPFQEQTGDLTAQYYGNVANRTVLEAKSYYWAEKYMKTHTNMEVYLDTDYMRIYKINQVGIHSLDLLK